MINFNKSPKIPESLKSQTSYTSRDVIDQLQEDFSNKCYICEYRGVTNANVEHFKPHRNDKTLKYEWANLFLSCGHCNNSKLAKYDGKLLNCTNPAHDVLKWIKYERPMWPRRKVLITAVKSGDELVTNTVELLNMVYNSENTAEKRLEAKNLSEHVYEELLIFQTLINEYLMDTTPEYKEKLKNYIISHIKKSSAFTAFKRWVILEDEEFKNEFEQFFD